MLTKFKETIFNNYFTPYDKRSDLNPDAEGKGVNQRFHECVGEDIDEEVVPLIDDFRDNVMNPQLCYPRFIPYRESTLGYEKEAWASFFTLAMAKRRIIANIMPNIYRIRGTKKAYRVMFKWLGMTVIFTEYHSLFVHWDGFTDGGTLDSDEGTFDSACDTCSMYKLELFGTPPTLTAEMMALVNTVIEFNQPINAILTELEYNGTSVFGDYNDDFSNDFSH